MSSYYSASQFDHAFKPTLLGNNYFGTNPWPGKLAICSPPKPKGYKITFIANDCGHLLPWVPRNPCTSPWGDYAMSIWEQTCNCQCISMLRHPERFIPPRPIFITKEVKNPNAFAAQAAREINDPNNRPEVVQDMIEKGSKKKKMFASVMCGDPKSVTKRMREKRRAEKKAINAGRGPSKGPDPGSQVVTFQLNSQSCGDAPAATSSGGCGSQQC